MTGIAAGHSHNLAVVGDDGRVYAWGWNYSGQLGQGDHGFSTVRSVPTLVSGVSGAAMVAASTNHSLVLCRDGTVMSCGHNYDGQLGIRGRRRATFSVVNELPWGVVAIDAGISHSIAVTLEGAVYTWGKGLATGHGGDDFTKHLVPKKVTGGGLGDATMVHVAAGGYHSMALTCAAGSRR